MADTTPETTGQVAEQALALAESVPVMSRRLAAGVEADEQLHRQAALGMGVAAVAHELNNLLTPLLSYAQLATERPDDKRIADRSIAASLAAGEQMRRVIAALSQFAGPEADSVAEEADTQADARAAAHAALACLPGLGTRIDIDLPTRAVAISSVALQQVFFNLITNASKAQDGAGSVAIVGTSLGDAFRCTVSDCGPGLPSSLDGRWFEPYTTTGGTGLGLYLTSHLLKRRGGTIAAETSPNGTVFTLSLPWAA